jgi:large subunit ribosomal protein L18
MALQRKKQKRYQRHKRVRAKIFGTAAKPRFCVFRSNKHIYAQLIDDEKGKTLLSVSDKGMKKGEKTKAPGSKKTSVSFEIGKLIAQKAKALEGSKKIEKVVFDRGGYPYHGRIKSLAEGAREGGLKF